MVWAGSYHKFELHRLIGGMYLGLGITCGLTQPQGLPGAWSGLLQRAKLCEWVTSRWDYPSYWEEITICIMYIIYGLTIECKAITYRAIWIS